MERYQIESQGHWKYLIVDMTKEVTKLYKDQPTRHSPVMLAYSKRVAEICVAALNNKVAQNSTDIQHAKATICPHYGKEIVNRYTGESEIIHHCRSEGKL